MPLRSSPWLSAARSLSACADSVCWRSDVDGSLDVDTMSFVTVRPNLKARSIPQWTYAYSGVPGGSPLQRSNPPSHLMLPSSVPSDFLAPPTRRVVRRRPTWPSASRTDPGTAWSAQAKWDHQRTMYVDTSPARSLSRHELRQPSSRRRLRHG